MIEKKEKKRCQKKNTLTGDWLDDYQDMTGWHRPRSRPSAPGCLDEWPTLFNGGLAIGSEPKGAHQIMGQGPSQSMASKERSLNS